MTEWQTISTEIVDRIATVYFDRPEKKNAMSPQLHREMHALLLDLQDDDTVDVLVITGRGDSFSAGQDLKEYFYENQGDPHAHRRDRWQSHEWRHRLLKYYPKPTICAINGYCFGGAFTVVGSCDIAIASYDATFGASEINWGAIPGGLVAKVLTDVVRPRDALFYTMTGRQFDGRRAEEMGLVTMSVPADELMTTALDIAHELQAKDQAALRATKLAMKGINLHNLSEEESWRWLENITEGLKLTKSSTGTSPGAAGLQAFVDKEYRPGFQPSPRTSEPRG